MLPPLVIATWLALQPSPAEAEALRSWDPLDLTMEMARDNILYARLAAGTTGTDEHELLFIAWHESRFHQDTVTREPGHKVSCGVMTPVPMRRCHRKSLAEQYLDGARHLREWYQVCDGEPQCALLGYAGGYALIRACRRGPMWRRRGVKKIDLCATAALYRSGAAQLAGRL